MVPVGYREWIGTKKLWVGEPAGQALMYRGLVDGVSCHTAGFSDSDSGVASAISHMLKELCRVDYGAS